MNKKTNTLAVSRREVKYLISLPDRLYLLDALSPVSYTHLDVYKRQLPLIRQKRGMGQRPVIKADVEGIEACRKGQLHHILHGHNTLIRPFKYDIGCLLYTSREAEKTLRFPPDG